MAAKLFERNQSIEFDGFISDTTWSIIPNYVTAILMVSFLNTSLPLAFSFGQGETCSLYTLLLKTVEEKLKIDFKGSIFESDQGNALLSVCQDFGMKHLCCLKHLLTSMKNFGYFYEIQHILKCKSTFELDNCFKIFALKFLEICAKDENEFIKINISLQKVGLIFLDGQISIENQERWEQVSMAERCRFHMPSTTNTLEATHGHLNNRTPRNNLFFQLILRIHNGLIEKYLKINEKIQHNYRYLKCKTLMKIQTIKSEEMANLCAFYDTDESSCLCSNNKLMASLYKADIPCIHRIKKGAVFPEIPLINLNIEDSYEGITFDYEILEENEPANPSINYEIEYIVRTIKNFSKYKNIDEIREFVNANYDNENDSFFINDQKVSIIQLIEEGIYIFKKKEIK